MDERSGNSELKMCFGYLLKGENIVGHCLKALKEKQSLTEQLYQLGWNFGIWTISYNGFFLVNLLILDSMLSSFNLHKSLWWDPTVKKNVTGSKLKLAALCGLLECAMHVSMCDFCSVLFLAGIIYFLFWPWVLA